MFSWEYSFFTPSLLIPEADKKLKFLDQKEESFLTGIYYLNNSWRNIYSNQALIPFSIQTLSINTVNPLRQIRTHG